MKTKNVLTVVAAAAFAVFAQGAFAQASAPSRGEVKAETKAAEKSGTLTPAGQGPGAMTSDKGGMSTKTRAERKGETKAARASGDLKPAGEASDMKTDKMEKNAKSTKTRAERKAETKAAIKAHQTTPAGEATQPAGEAPKK